MKKKRLLLRTFGVFLLFLVVNQLKAQPAPFWSEIQAFKKLDSIANPPDNAILFIGSSSFKFWKDVDAYFPGYKIINRGFGGSSLPDVIRYVSDIIYPYHPKQVVIYCGENDLAASDTVSAEIVVRRFRELFSMIRSQLGDVNVTYVSVKPSPSRSHLMPKMMEANDGIEKFLKTKKKTAFVDVYHKMLDQQGEPVKALFVKDNLHMNARGYAIWKQAIQPYLLK